MKTLISKELYESLKKENDILLEKICKYEDDNEIPVEVVRQYKSISRKMIEYEHAYHPLPGRFSTIAQRKSSIKFERANVKMNASV
jgi:hypothetical protein